MGNEKHVECINEVRRQIQNANPNVGYVRFLLAGSNGITGQAIEFVEKVTKKDKTIKEVKRKDFVTHDYCPFCGEKYI